MLDTRLVLIEGLGGSGKTTTVRALERALREEGVDPVAIVERDDVHPRFEFPRSVEGYAERMLEEWSLFVAGRERDGRVCVMEGHGWQPMAEFMYLAGSPRRSVLDFCDRVASVVRPLAPAVVYYAHDDVAAHLERVRGLRGAEWIRFMEERDTLHHGLDRFGGSLLRFWSEWNVLQDEIFARSPFRKLRIRNPHHDRDAAYAVIRDFLRLGGAM